MVLNGALLDTTQVAICVMLGSLLLFAGQYAWAGGWFRDMLGWSVMVERLAFITLLVLLLLQQYWPSLVIHNASDLLLAQAVLLLVASVGINMGNAVMYDLRCHPVVVRRHDTATGAGKQQRP